MKIFKPSKKSYGLLITVIAFSAFYFSCGKGYDSENPGDVEEHLIHFRNGNNALNQGNYELAEKEFKAAIEGYPNNAPYHNYLGLTYFFQNKYNEALIEFDNGLKITTEYGDLHNNRGLVFLALGKNDDALNEFKKALNTPAYQAPETAYFNIGRIYFTREQWVEAAFNFEKTIDILKTRKNQPHPEALCYYGISLLKQGKFFEAIAPLSEAIKANPKYLLAQYNVGIAYFKTGDKDRALKHFMEVRTLSSVDDPLYSDATEYINKIKQGN
jgi:superkiller protein 3